MHVTVDQKALVEALKTVKPASANRDSLPILRYVLMSGQPDQFSLTASNLEMGMRSYLSPKQYQVTKPGQVLVDLNQLLKIAMRLRAAEDGQLSLEALNTEGTQVQVTCRGMTVELPGMSPQEYPVVKHPPAGSPLRVLIQRKALADGLSRTAPFMSQDETRPNLNGIFLKVLATSDSMTKSGLLRLVSTNGHVLSLCEKVAILRGNGSITGLERIIPAKAIAAIPKQQHGFLSFLFPTEAAEQKEEMLWITGEYWELALRCVPSDFPDYAKVLPSKQTGEIIFDPTEMLSVLSGFQPLITPRAHALKMEIKEGRLTFTFRNPDIGTATESLSVDQRGDPHQTGISQVYLTQALKSFLSGAQKGGEAPLVAMAYTEEIAPMLFHEFGGGNGIIVIMPTKLS